VYIEAAARFAANQEGAPLEQVHAQMKQWMTYLLQLLLHAEV